MLTKLQFQTLFGFKPKRRKATSKAGKKVVKKSNKIGTRMVKGVKRTVYKGKNGGKFYKKADGRKVYFGPAVMGPSKIMYAKAIEGAGYTLGYKAANAGVSMLKKIIKKKKKTVAMGAKKLVAGKKRTVYKTPTGAKYYKSAKGNKVYFGHKGTNLSTHRTDWKANKSASTTRTNPNAFFGKRRKSRRNTRFGNHGCSDLTSMMGPSGVMFASSIPSGL